MPHRGLSEREAKLIQAKKGVPRKRAVMDDVSPREKPRERLQSRVRHGAAVHVGFAFAEKTSPESVEGRAPGFGRGEHAAGA